MARLLPLVVALVHWPGPITRGNDPPDVKKELAKLEGVRAIEAQMVAGKDVAKELPLPSMRITIKGDTLIRGNGGFSVESKIAIDPSKHPKAIDLVTRLPGGGSETAVGIYALSGESLKICYDATGKQRPKEFKSAEGSTVVLSVLKRPK